MGTLDTSDDIGAGIFRSTEDDSGRKSFEEYVAGATAKVSKVLKGTDVNVRHAATMATLAYTSILKFDSPEEAEDSLKESFDEMIAYIRDNFNHKDELLESDMIRFAH